MAPGLDLSALAHEIEEPGHSTLPKKTFQTTPSSSSQGTIVLDPSQITSEFDSLRFGAAAFDQLHTNDLKQLKNNGDLDSNNEPLLSSLLISSPYNNPGHYLDLKSLDGPNLVFSKALTALAPARPDYATAYYTEALNFSDLLELVRNFSRDEGFEWKEHSFYVVVFRSRLKDTIDNDLLYKLDYESHREACESGGLLKYWFGSPDGERRNLATCFWRSREDARKGGLGPWHKKARAAATMYETITFATHRFTILDGATEFKLEDWVE